MSKNQKKAQITKSRDCGQILPQFSLVSEQSLFFMEHSIKNYPRIDWIAVNKSMGFVVSLVKNCLC